MCLNYNHFELSYRSRMSLLAASLCDSIKKNSFLSFHLSSPLSFCFLTISSFNFFFFLCPLNSLTLSLYYFHSKNCQFHFDNSLSLFSPEFTAIKNEENLVRSGILNNNNRIMDISVNLISFWERERIFT